MSRIRSKDSRPEVKLRRLLFSLGYRYRLQAGGLPGRPDVAFTARRKAVFLHGCFWHCHRGCPRASTPKSRREYWGPKLRRNRERDAEVLAALRAEGWDAHVVWECELGDERLPQRLCRFLGPPKHR